MRKTAILNTLLGFIFCLLLVVFSVFTLIHSAFKDVDSTVSFLKKAQVFSNGAEIAKIEIRNHYPPVITGNVLVKTAADGFINKFVTGDLLARGSARLLHSALGIASLAQTTPDGSIIIDTTPYREELSQRVQKEEVPKFLSGITTQLVDSLPSSVDITPERENANYVMRILIKLSSLLSYSETIYFVLLVLMGVLTLLLLLNNKKTIQWFFLTIGIVFGLSSLAVYLFSVALPEFLKSTMPATSLTSLSTYQSKLIIDFVSYLFTFIQSTAVWYLFIAFGSFVIWGILRFLIPQAKTKKGKTKTTKSSKKPHKSKKK